MIKLDLYDKKILEILLINAREQISSIGRKIRLRRENVNYRINRLIKEGLIKEPLIILNEEKFGLSRYVLFVELINLHEDFEKNILDYLKHKEYISWIGIHAGKWSLIFDVLIKEKSDLDNVISDFLNKFRSFIGDYTILNSREIRYYPEKMLELNTKDKFIEKTENAKLDKIDIKILSILNDNAWSNYVEIAKKIGLTANAINRRIKNLELKRIIISYTISLDWRKLGWELYEIQLKIIKFGNGINEKLTSYFKKDKRVLFYYIYFGGIWDYDVGVIVKNSEELREYINEFRNVFSSTVKIFAVSAILREVTGYRLPKEIFE